MNSTAGLDDLLKRDSGTDAQTVALQDKSRAATAAIFFHRPVPGDPSAKVLNGKDGRQEVNAINIKWLQNIAKSTCLVTSRSRIKKEGSEYLLTLEPWREEEREPCDEERFREQKTGGWCSAFLVAPNLVATAGHCCENSDEARETAFVFGFYANHDGTSPSQFRADQIYLGTRLVQRGIGPGNDFALIELDRAVKFPQATPLKVRVKDSPSHDLQVGVIGYPAGLPAKVCWDAESKIRKMESRRFFTNLDTYIGNSGSPVFNQEGVVEGILVAGAEDFSFYDDRCFSSVRAKASAATEEVTRSSVFSAFIHQ